MVESAFGEVGAFLGKVDIHRECLVVEFLRRFYRIGEGKRDLRHPVLVLRG